MAQALAGMWLIIGILVVIIMVFLSLFKICKWKITGIISLVYIVVLIILMITVGSSNDTDTNNAASSSDAKVFRLIYSDDNDYDNEIRFDSNKNGDYTVKVKALRNGKVKLQNANSDEEAFKAKTYNVKKGETLKIPIHLKNDDFVHEFELSDNNDNSKDFSIYNNSDAANSSVNSMSASESAEEASESTNGEDNSTDNSSVSLKKYSSNSKAAAATNKDFQNSANDALMDTKVTYNGSIFYVTVPNSTLEKSPSQLKSYLESIITAIRAHQKTPHGVVDFEDESGNMIAQTKALDDSQVKLK